MKQRIKETYPADKLAESHYTDPHMDRRLKAYREQNVHDSGNSVQCFFSKMHGRENLKVVNAMDDADKNFDSIQ